MQEILEKKILKLIINYLSLMDIVKVQIRYMNFMEIFGTEILNIILKKIYIH